MANELANIKRLLRTSPEDPNIVQEQDWDGLVSASQSALDQKAPLKSPKFDTRLDLAAAAFSASFRDDGAGNLGWYVGVAGALDGAQLKVATVDKATGGVAFSTAAAAPYARIEASGFSAGYRVLQDWISFNDAGRTTFSGLHALQTATGAIGLEAFNHVNAKISFVLQPYGGNVGVGTATPNDLIHIAADAAPTGTTKYGLRATTTGTEYGARFLGYLEQSVGSGALIETVSSGVPTERLRINNSGNVGIGTSAPGLTLEVAGATNGGVRMRQTGTGSTHSDIVHQTNVLYITNASPSGPISMWSGGVERVAIGSTIAINAAALAPTVDNATQLGIGSNRWSHLYVADGVVSTSDAAEKALRDGTPIGGDWRVSPLTSAEITAAQALLREIGIYKWQDAVDAKGDAARLHIGLTVQRAIEIMQSHGLNPWRYGLICKDEITRKVKVMQAVTEQKTEPDPEFDIAVEIIDGMPTQVRKARNPKPVFEMKPLIGLEGEVVMRTVIVEGESGFPVEHEEPVLHPVPVMIEVEREVEIEEPAGDRLGFRYDQLNMFLIAALAEAAIGGP